jgi:hypothetical protein
MRVISLESAPLVERQHIREGIFRSRRILNGAPGTPGNFSLQIGVTPSYFSPRHRHNFDQVRYQLDGDFDFGPDGLMKAGTIGYFPEGTYYGPQSSATENSTLVLQFGGASRSGYISAEQYEKAAAELSKHGTFSKGVYTQLKPDGGKINKDAYEAVWEQVNGRPLVYPKQRYLRPVFMDPESFDWIRLDRQPGVSWKNLGEFSERLTRLSLYKISPGAAIQLVENSIYFVLAGSGSADGKPFERHATIYLQFGEHGTACVPSSAAAPAEFLHIGLPHFD